MPTDLAVTPPAALSFTPPNAMSLLAHAVQEGNTAMVETLARLASSEREKNEVAAFNRSMHQAQSEMKRIGADATNPQTRSKYVTFSKMDGALRPIYTQHGFSVSFNTADHANPDMVRVIAYVSHEEGHGRTYQIDMPADGKGAKGGDVMTKTHATGAATSYGARYLLKMIFNVAVGETDDDGNAASGSKVGEGQLADYLASIEAATNEEELKAVYAPAYRFAKGQGDQSAMQSIRRAYEARKAAL